MIIKSENTQKVINGVMKIWSYKINSKFSGSLIELNGRHEKMKCTCEERIYFIVEGKGEFIVGNQSSEVKIDILPDLKDLPPVDFSATLRSWDSLPLAI